MKDTQFESLVELYQETGNIIVLNKIRKIYGDTALLEMGKRELKIYIETLLSGKYSLLYDIERIDRLRMIYDYIVSEFSFNQDYEYSNQVIELLREFDFYKGSHKKKKENIQFLSRMVTYLKEKGITYKEEEGIDYTDDIINALIENPHINMDILMVLAKLDPRFYVGVISNIYRLFPIRNLFDVIYEIHQVKSEMEFLLESNKSPLFHVEELINEGIRNILESAWWYDNGFSIFNTINNTKVGLITIYKDVYRLFISNLFLTSDAMIDNVKLSFDTYLETDGEYPIDLVTSSIDKSSLEAIFYILFYGEEILENFRNFLFYDATGLEVKIQRVLDIFMVLISEKILPEDIKSNTSGFIESLATLSISTGDNNFDLESFLNEVNDMDEE